MNNEKSGTPFRTKGNLDSSKLNDDLLHYNQLFEAKENELREINHLRVKNLENLLEKKEETYKNIQSELLRTKSDVTNTQNLYSLQNAQVEEYQEKFLELRNLLVEKNQNIVELESQNDIIEREWKEKLRISRINEENLIDKNNLLREESKSLQWKYDQLMRDQELETQSYKEKMNYYLAEKENILNMQKDYLQNQISKNVNEKNKEFTTEKHRLNMEMESKNNENLRLKVETDQLHTQNEDMKLEITKIKTSLDNYTMNYELTASNNSKKMSELSMKLTTIERENEFNLRGKENLGKEFNTRLQQLMNEKQTLEINYNTLKQKYDLDMKSHQDNKQLDIERTTITLNSKLQKLEENIGKRDKENDHLLLENSDLKNEITDLERKLYKQSGEKDNLHKKQMLVLEDHIQEIKMDLKEKEMEMMRYKEQNQRLEGVIYEKTEQIKRLKAEYSNQQEVIETMKDENFKYKNNMKREKRDYEEEISFKVGKNIKDLKNELVELKVKNESLAEDLEEQKNTKKRMNNKYTAKLKHLETKIRALQTDTKIMGSKKPKIPFLDSNYSFEDGESDTLNKIMDNSEEIMKFEEEEIDNSKKKISKKSNTKLTPTQREFQGLKEQLDQKKIKILELENENDELKAVITEMKEEMENIRFDMLKMHKTKQLDSQLMPKPKFGDMIQLESQLKRAKLELEHIELEKKDLQNKVNLLNLDIHTKNDKYRKMEENYISRENYLLEAKQKNITYEQSILKLKSERDKLIEISNNLRVELNSLKRKFTLYEGQPIPEYVDRNDIIIPKNECVQVDTFTEELTYYEKENAKKDRYINYLEESRKSMKDDFQKLKLRSIVAQAKEYTASKIEFPSKPDSEYIADSKPKEEPTREDEDLNSIPSQPEEQEALPNAVPEKSTSQRYSEAMADNSIINDESDLQITPTKLQNVLTEDNIGEINFSFSPKKAAEINEEVRVEKRETTNRYAAHKMKLTDLKQGKRHYYIIYRLYEAWQ